MQKFLVCLDYDTGGIWRVVLAESALPIQEKYPELQIANHKPGWMNDDMYSDLVKNAIELTDSNNSLFKAILLNRSG